MSNHPIDTDFSFLPGDLSPESALSLLGTSRYGIVLDPASGPIAVVSPLELVRAVSNHAPQLVCEAAWLTPTILIPSGTTVGEIIKSPVFELLDLLPRGLVVMGEAETVGVLSRASVQAIRTSSFGISRGTVGASMAIGDSGLGGSIRVPTGSVLCREKNCGYPNKIVQILKDKPPLCQNPRPPRHLLKLRP